MKLIDEVLNDLEESRDYWLKQVTFWGEKRDLWRKNKALGDAETAQKYRLEAMDEALYYTKEINEYKSMKH